MNSPAAPLRIRDWLIGQDAVFEQFESGLRHDRLAHAYLFLGPRGCGKTRTALAVAQALLCETAAPPCGACPGCIRAARLVHPDLHFLFPATREEAEDTQGRAALLEAYVSNRYHVLEYAASASIGIDRIRALKEEVAKSRVEGERRVVVLSDAPRLTEQAAQSALKLVEEPPPQTVLILTAEDTAQLLPTLVSRCQRLRLASLPRSEMLRILQEELGADPVRANLYAALSRGSLGQAHELANSDVLVLRDRILEAFDVSADGLVLREVERRIQALERTRVFDSARRAGELLLLWYRDVLAAQAGMPRESLGNADRVPAAVNAGEALSVEEIGRRIRAVEEMMQAFEQNVNPALAAHVALTRIGSRPGEEGFLF